MRRRAFALSSLLLLSAAAGAAAAEREVSWLREHAIALRPAARGGDDFADLEPLKAVLAGRRVVLLGEATHGDGAVFAAKARLVRFLHEAMGFDVLAFESGAYDCWKAWQVVQAGGDAEQAFHDSVFPIWTRSEQVQPLVEHFAEAARTPRPLELAGIDPQFTGALSGRSLLADLVGVAAAVGIPAEAFRVRIAGPLGNLVEGRYETGELPEPASRQAFVDALGELHARLAARPGAVPDTAFWLRLVASTREHAPSSWTTDFQRPMLEQPVPYQLRERLMGEQLAWLAGERYRGRKIVVWLHSGHAFRNVESIDVPSEVHRRLYRTLRPAGEVARDALGGELYVVGTLAYQGEYATVFDRPERLLQPTAGSLEDLLHRGGLAHAFLDLAGAGGGAARWLREPLVARPVGYKEMKARWPEVFDGFLFVDRMEVSRPAAVRAGANDG